MKHTLIKICLSILLISAGIAAHAQSRAAIKTNFVPDALASPNLGIEIGLSPQWTLDISGEVNLWEVNRHKWKHWMVSPEIRVWVCDRFAGSFFGLHAIGGQYNFGNLHNNIKFLGSDFSQLTDHRFEGWAAGAGIGYGYSWILGNHWNLEFEIGVGYIFTRYNKFECYTCSEKLEENKAHNYFGPTKLSLALEYMF